MIKKVLIALAIVLVLIQFVRPEKNLSGDNTYAIESKYNVPPEVATLIPPPIRGIPISSL
jgi:hypothetical protein